MRMIRQAVCGKIHGRPVEGVNQANMRMPEEVIAFPEGSAYTFCMQYTIRNIPRHVDQAVRRRARAEGRSINDVAIEALERGMGVAEGRTRYRSLSGIAGTWTEDSDFDAALDEQDRVDDGMWS